MYRRDVKPCHYQCSQQNEILFPRKAAHLQIYWFNRRKALFLVSRCGSRCPLAENRQYAARRSLLALRRTLGLTGEKITSGMNWNENLHTILAAEKDQWHRWRSTGEKCQRKSLFLDSISTHSASNVARCRAKGKWTVVTSKTETLGKRGKENVLLAEPTFRNGETWTNMPFITIKMWIFFGLRLDNLISSSIIEPSPSSFPLFPIKR